MAARTADELSTLPWGKEDDGDIRMHALESHVVGKCLEDDRGDSLEEENPSRASMRAAEMTEYMVKDVEEGKDRDNTGYMFANLFQRDYLRGNDHHHRVDTRTPHSS